MFYPPGNRWVTLVLEDADLPHAAPAPRIHPPYRPSRPLAKLDQRTKEARLMRETRAEVAAHVGGKPSAVQAAMIERACQLTRERGHYAATARRRAADER